MAIIEPLLLPADVSVIKVTELNEAIRAKLPCEDDDFVISKPNSRFTSQVIDATLAELLGEFRAPSTIVDAIIRYSVHANVAPSDVLDNAYSALAQLYKIRFLVKADESDQFAIVPALSVNSMVEGYQILSNVQTLEDTDIYKVQSPNGQTYALKYLRDVSNHHVKALFQREAAVLAHVKTDICPVLHETHIADEAVFLVTEWCEGETADLAARKLREENRFVELFQLCRSIIDSYAELHAQGVMHGDVHPRNIIISPRGKVKIIDFGFARCDAIVKYAGKRGGVSYYFEPEYAAAYLGNATLPPVTPISEQYALAAMLYYLLEGSHYIEFPLERDQAYQEIIQTAPSPLTDRGTLHWSKISQVLHRALSKQPSDRYASTLQFAEAIHACQGISFASPAPQTADETLEAILQTTVQRFGLHSKLIHTGLPASPISSVNFGAAGIAYLFYRVASLREDPYLLATADAWVNKAQADCTLDGAFTSAELDIHPHTIGPISLYHTMAGVHCVQALISQATGAYGSVVRAVQDFIASSSQTWHNLDLTIGLSSVLVGCSLLYEACAEHKQVADLILQHGNAVLKQIWSVLDTYSPIQTCRDVEFLGMAHGWAGFCYATLHWCEATHQTPPPSVQIRLNELQEIAIVAPDGICWKRTMAGNAIWPGWCHGSAGYVHLWALAYRTFAHQEYLFLAEGAAHHSWANQDGQSSNLCCGLTGQAYAMLTLYKLTHEQAWLTRAQAIEARIAKQNNHTTLRTNSLYKGELGIALLAADLASPDYSSMPLFESEGWHR